MPRLTKSMPAAIMLGFTAADIAYSPQSGDVAEWSKALPC
jgi:hypothetical protein